jgi:hypothetical protein
MSILRKHWLLILLIVIGLLWWHIYDLVMPSPQLPNWNDSSQSFDYWSMISHPEVGWIALAGFVLIWILVFIRMWRVSRIIYRSVLIIATLSLCLVSTVMPVLFSTEDSRTIQHVMSVTYQDHVYHLAFYKHDVVMDSGSSSYYIFECDTSGNKCSKIFDDVGGEGSPSKLLVSDKKLIYESPNYTYQILPAVN